MSALTLEKYQQLHNQPEVKERLAILDQFEQQAILDRVAPKAPGPNKPTFIGGNTFIALTTIRHKHKAINALVLGQLQDLDATIGDASCEERVPLIMDLYNCIAAVLQDGDMSLIQGYITAHARDKVDTKVHTKADALGAPHSPAYDELVQRVKTALGKDGIILAHLCYTFTENSVWSKDEMNLLFSYCSKAPMDVAGEDVLKSNNRADLIKLEQDLRVELARYALATFQSKITMLPHHENLIPNAPQFFIDNQLLVASKIMQSFILSTVPYPFQDFNEPVPSLRAEQVKLPVLPIFNQIFAIFYMLFNEHHGIVVRVRSDEMTPIPGSQPKARFTQKFAGIYYLLFKLNPSTGLFEVVTPTVDDRNANFMVLDTWSKFLVGTTGTGLDAANLDEHHNTLAGSNLLYKAVCMLQLEGVAFHPTRKQFPGLHLQVNAPNETHPNLHDLWVLARKHGEQRTLHDNCQAITGPFGRNLYEHINRPVDFQVNHIFSAPLTWIDTNTCAVKAKHEAAPQAVFGPIVIHMGDTCFSFVEPEKAHEVLTINNDNKKKATYKKIHPKNADFIKA